MPAAPGPAALLAVPAPLPSAAAMLDQVQAWILSGASEHHVAEAAAAAWPQAETQPLIVAAIDRIQAAARFDRDLVSGFCLEATRELYRRMLEIGDFTGALKAIRQLHELARVIDRNRTDVRHPTEQTQ